jgi:hypothetical protein
MESRFHSCQRRLGRTVVVTLRVVPCCALSRRCIISRTSAFTLQHRYRVHLIAARMGKVTGSVKIQSRLSFTLPKCDDHEASRAPMYSFSSLIEEDSAVCRRLLYARRAVNERLSNPICFAFACSHLVPAGVVSVVHGEWERPRMPLV